MAKCDQGYLCEVCGEDVAEIKDSDLYLRFVVGEISGFELMSAPERHILCNPTQAQFIVDPEFTPVVVTGLFDKRLLDPEDVERREALITRGWHRLRELQGSGLPISDYPLPEFRDRRTET